MIFCVENRPKINANVMRQLQPTQPNFLFKRLLGGLFDKQFKPRSPGCSLKISLIFAYLLTFRQ